jgi:hypothetical protein
MTALTNSQNQESKTSDGSESNVLPERLKPYAKAQTLDIDRPERDDFKQWMDYYTAETEYSAKLRNNKVPQDQILGRLAAVAIAAGHTSIVEIGSWSGGHDSGDERVDNLPIPAEDSGVEPITEYEEDYLRDICHDTLGYGSYAMEMDTFGRISLDSENVVLTFDGKETDGEINDIDSQVSISFPIDGTLIRWDDLTTGGWQDSISLRNGRDRSEDTDDIFDASIFIIGRIGLPTGDMTDAEQEAFERLQEFLSSVKDGFSQFDGIDMSIHGGETENNIPTIEISAMIGDCAGTVVSHELVHSKLSPEDYIRDEVDPADLDDYA